MTFAGVDLAWGWRNTTGLCVLRGATVVDSTLVRTDDEIFAWLRPYTRGPCVVGIDAPLIVSNATGARPCERALNRCFAAHHSGCLPANTALVPPRAERLASALRLHVDPVFPPGARVRRAVEVYPHAATVALFGLARTLKYKHRRGRTSAGRHAAFAELVRHLRTLAEADPPMDVATAPRFEALARTVTTATVHAQLDRAEDELDAFISAYVAAMLWTHGSARTRIVGDTTSGYIVVPVTPPLAACLDGASASPPRPSVTTRRGRPHRTGTTAARTGDPR